MYLPPSQSLYYTDTEIDNGVALLEQCIIGIFEESGELPIIIWGDLNAKRDVQLLDDAAEDVFDEDIIDGIGYGSVQRCCLKRVWPTSSLRVRVMQSCCIQ